MGSSDAPPFIFQSQANLEPQQLAGNPYLDNARAKG
jgi:hypothetical protein